MKYKIVTMVVSCTVVLTPTILFWYLWNAQRTDFEYIVHAIDHSNYHVPVCEKEPSMPQEQKRELELTYALGMAIGTLEGLQISLVSAGWKANLTPMLEELHHKAEGK